MPSHDPAAALAAGTTVVTPNNRLARALIARHDAAMARKGKRAWQAGLALPWSAWLATLWREALEAGAAAADIRLLSDSESHHTWVAIVRDALPEGLADVRGAADSAEEAWALMHAWGTGGPSYRAWQSDASESDVAAFADWASRYHANLEAAHAVDRATLADAIRALAPRMPSWRGRDVLLAGFLELTPQQERLREALTEAGMRIADARAPSKAGEAHRYVGATSRDELRAALEWARERALADPGQSIGVAVVDLAIQRDDVRAAADDVLCPARQAPGRMEDTRPYTMSLGAPLAAHAMAACALDLVALVHDELGRGEAAALARSPFLAGPWPLRAGCERRWIEEGRTRIAWADFVDAMPPAAASAMRSAADAVSKRAQSPAGFAAQWRTLLERCGWPGDTPLDGARYEVRQAWERLLDAFSRIGYVQARMRAGEAVATLRDMARRTIFEPQAPRTAITIAGLNDAAALDFDALWVVGLSAQRWPPAPQPHPMLPVAWQRERGVPGASAARELAFARRVTARLAACADTVVMSAPAAMEDYESAPSALLDPAWPDLVVAAEGVSTIEAIVRARSMEDVADERAPPFGEGPAPGGAGTIASQSTCPFQAFARRRLRVEPWPGGYEALSYAERGQLVHAMMASFWLEVRTHAALVALGRPALEARIAGAAEAARATIPEARWKLLPPVIAAAEIARIAQIGREWIEGFELARPPFAVTGVEQKAEVTLAGLTFRLKLDRIDTLADGSTAIIDYKTGAADKPQAWFAERPRSPQLGLYALALRDTCDVRTVAYARLKAGDIEALGIAEGASQWKALTPAAALREPNTWPAIEDWWSTRLPGIAAEFRDGIASVTPRDPPACCRSCRLQALCRIEETTQGAGEATP